MKTINSFRSKLLALTLALMASVSIQAHDFSVDGIYYNILDGNNVEVTFKGSHVNQYVNEYINSINIPNEVTINNTTYTVTRVGDGAFYACRTLNSVTIPNSVTYIGDTAFYSCDDLTTVDIGNAVTRIGDGAFFRCSFLSSITIPNSVTRIGNRAFKYCYSMTSVNIGSSVTEIGEEAFDGCTVLNSVTIPNSVINIGAMAFQGCTYMTSVVIGNNVANIGNEAFRWCYSLTSVKCHNTTPPILGENIFEWGSLEMGPYELDTLYVPAESLNLYKEAEQWNLFNSILPIKETSYKDQWCDTWNVMWFDGMRFDETARTSKYRLGKDTVIGDYTYSKFIPGTYVRFTDDRKVYVYHEYFDDHDPYSEDLPTGEYLAYDFSAQVGDTLEVFSGVGTYSTYPCVVDDVQIDSETNLRTMTLHKICRIDEDEYDDLEMTWIEGVGSPEGFLISYRPCGWAGGGTYALLCAYQGDELKYTGSLYERFGCDYKAGVISDDFFPTLSGLQRTICREYCEQADNKTRIEQFTNLTTRTETGGPYLYYSPFLLREKDNKILIYSRSLNRDLVLYDFNLQVGDSLPMLYIDFFAKDDWIADRDMEIWCVVDYHKDLEGNILPADTLIVTDVSAITLLDGKEYKKWTFNNGMEYVEGIGSFGNDQWSGDFFQLIANKGVPTCLLDEHLVCASKNGQLLYQMDEAEMERLGAECLCEVETSYKSQWCDTWNMLVRTSSIYPPSSTPYRYQLAKDTVIGEHTYTAVVLLETKYFLDAPHYVAAVRFTDDRKVYIYYDNAEYLLYDFNVQEGDELEVFAGINNYTSEIKTYKCTVTGVEQYACVGCPAAITLEVHNHPNDFREFYRETQWIEGVGDINGFLNGINHYVEMDGGGSEYLLCAYKGDELKYTGDLYEEYGCGDDAEQSPEDLFPTLWGLQRTSCTKTIGEDEEGTVWGSRSYLMQETQTTTIDGKQYIVFGDEYDRFALREENNKILLYSSILKKDLVLYDFTLEVGDSLPALYYELRAHNAMQQWLYNGDIVDYNKDDEGTILPAETFVVTDISTITLLDGKEYKKWTFDNGMEYVEGIGSFGTSYAWNDFYQLIANGPLYSDVHSQHLVCASKNGQLLYQMDDAEMERLGAECLCDYNSGPKKDNAKNGKIGGRPTPTQWNMLEFETKEVDGTPTITRAETFSYTLENDSIVTKGKTFYQLARQSTKDTAITKSFVGALHFGEDEDNRVYFLRDGVEYVLYDFTAEPGDTIEIFAGINNYPQYTTYTHVVTGKDTLENGACRMILEVVFPEEIGSDLEQQHLQKVWLAGLGSIDGIVHNAATRATKARSSETQTSVMLCAWRDDNCLYTTDHPDYDSYGCVYNMPTSIKDIETPGGKCQKLLRDGHLYILRDNKLYDVLGTPLN